VEGGEWWHQGYCGWHVKHQCWVQQGMVVVLLHDTCTFAMRYGANTCAVLHGFCPPQPGCMHWWCACGYFTRLATANVAQVMVVVHHQITVWIGW
jgi:hypothetical protein